MRGTIMFIEIRRWKLIIGQLLMLAKTRALINFALDPTRSECFQEEMRIILERYFEQVGGFPKHEECKDCPWKKTNARP
jgi:hypothetical protein